MTEKMNYSITRSDSQRLDIAKVWFTIMVVFIHSFSMDVDFEGSSVVADVPLWLDTIKYVISLSISRCAVPAFFIISSILLFRKEFSWLDNIKKKAKSILVPYIILNAFWIVAYFVFQKISFTAPFFANEKSQVAQWGAVEWLDAFLGFRDSYPMLYILWFLRDLFVMNLIAPIIKFVVDKLPRLSAAIVLGLWIACNDTHIPFMNIQAICGFSMGYIIVKNDIHFSNIDKINPALLTISYVLLTVADVLTRDLGFNYCIKRVAIVVGLAFWFSVATKLNSEKVKNAVLVVSSYSFGIYLFHEKLLTFTKKIIGKLLPNSVVFQTLEYMFIPIIIVAICFVMCVVLNKILPKTYGLVTGNRKKART